MLKNKNIHACPEIILYFNFILLVNSGYRAKENLP